MGLLGVFLTLMSGGACVGSNIKQSYGLNKRREEARQNNEQVYFDGRGGTYLTATGEQVQLWGGKIYSTRHPNLVLANPRAEEFRKKNQELIDKARAEGKPYADLAHSKDDFEHWTWALTDLSTMKPYEVSKWLINKKTKLYYYYRSGLEFHYDNKYDTMLHHVPNSTTNIPYEEYKKWGGV